MRIALVCPYSFTRPGGVKQYVLGLYREFKKQNLYVKILTPRAQTPSKATNIGTLNLEEKGEDEVV